jgi:hypothetical protein
LPRCWAPKRRLSDNTAASQNLEVRKVVSGDVDGIFAIPRTHHTDFAQYLKDAEFLKAAEQQP